MNKDCVSGPGLSLYASTQHNYDHTHVPGTGCIVTAPNHGHAREFQQEEKADAGEPLTYTHTD